MLLEEIAFVSVINITVSFHKYVPHSNPKLLLAASSKTMMSICFVLIHFAYLEEVVST